MSITDELRDWFKDRMFMANGWQEIHAIADRIDAEHESACAEAYGDGVMSVPIALDESQWVKLPVDADGEVIRIGDVMEWISDDECYRPVIREVEAVGVNSFFAWDATNQRFGQYEANAYRHYHAPTVEDVLREFAEKIIDSQIPSMHPTYEEAIAEYAAKLHLAGDAE